MKAWGFVGYGNMGRYLVEGLLGAGALEQERVVVSTRTRERAEPLKQRYAAVELAADNVALAERCERIVLCVRPAQVREVLREMAPALRPGRHVVSVAACVELKDLVDIIGGGVSRLIPSLGDVSLVCHDGRSEAAAEVEALLSALGEVVRVEEEDLGVATALTSCAPAFFAQVSRELAEVGRRHSRLDARLAEHLVLSTLLGTARRLSAGLESPEELVRRVATPGGVTEAGLEVLREALPPLWERVLHATEERSRHLTELLRRT
jgi:pyrroline-5-carboxylate reductase